MTGWNGLDLLIMVVSLAALVSLGVFAIRVGR